MTEWYTTDHVKQGKRDYTVGGRSLMKVRISVCMVKAQVGINLRRGFGEMRLTRIIYWRGEFKKNSKKGNGDTRFRRFLFRS